MVRDAAAAPGIFSTGTLMAHPAAAMAARSRGAAGGPALLASEGAAHWRRNLLLTRVFGNLAVTAVLELDVPAAEAIGIVPHFASFLLFRGGVHFFLPPARIIQSPPAPPASAPAAAASPQSLGGSPRISSGSRPRRAARRAPHRPSE